MYDHGPHREFLFGQVPQGTVKLSADISSKGKAEGGFNKEGWNPRILTNDDAIFLGLLCVLNPRGLVSSARALTSAFKTSGCTSVSALIQTSLIAERKTSGWMDSMFAITSKM